MKIIVAPTAFKGSLTPRRAAALIARALRRLDPAAGLVELPLADGGDGTLEVLCSVQPHRILSKTVLGPRGIPIRARFALLRDRTAVIEMAEASGLKHVPPKRRNPRRTSSRGTGQLIRGAFEAGAKHILLGVGGSATVDGGAGALQELGIRFLDRRGRDIAPVGGSLPDIRGMVSERSIPFDRITVLCDVKNPLVGPTGAAAVFGPQKGATSADVRFLDHALRHFAALLKRATGHSVGTIPGGGAAGGLAAGFAAFGARLVEGGPFILNLLDFEDHLKGADLVITGEGRVDRTTTQGKVIGTLCRTACRAHVPVGVLCGSATVTARSLGADALASLTEIAPSQKEAIKHPARFMKPALTRLLERLQAATEDGR